MPFTILKNMRYARCKKKIILTIMLFFFLPIRELEHEESTT